MGNGGTSPRCKKASTHRWIGKTVAIIASGPSLTKEQCDYVRKSGWKTIAINTSYKLAPWADVIYGCDGAWWHQNHRNLPEEAEKWTQDKNAHINLGVNYVEAKWGAGLNTKTKPHIQIHHGKNSGYQAINLAYHWGVSRIILLGYDMQHTRGKAHWFGDHPKSLTNAHGIEGWVKDFAFLARDLKSEGVQVFNCSPETALTCFERVELEHLD